MSRRNRFYIPTLMVVLSVIVGLALVEVTLYFTYRDVQIGGIHSPSGWTFYPKYYHTNGWGFRDVERQVKKSPNIKRILVLGDSFTFGAGVKRAADLYPALLESRLGSAWEVINTGRRGLSTAQQLDYLLDQGLALEPDLLIVGHVLNDVETEGMQEELERDALRSSWLPDRFHRRLLHRSFIYYLTSRSMQGTLQQWGKKEGDELVGYDAYLHAIHRHENFKDYATIVSKLAKTAEQSGISVIWMSFPNFRYVHDDSYPFAEIRRKLRELALEQGFIYLDLYEPIRASGMEVLTVSAWDEHPNEAVHAIAAEQLHSLLVADGMVPDAGQGKLPVGDSSPKGVGFRYQRTNHEK